MRFIDEQDRILGTRHNSLLLLLTRAHSWYPRDLEKIMRISIPNSDSLDEIPIGTVKALPFDPYSKMVHQVEPCFRWLFFIAKIAED